MKKKNLSGKTGVKIIWVLISYIGILSLSFGLTVYATVYERTGYGTLTDIFSSEDQEYLDSDYFNGVYLDTVDSLADYIRYQKVFETENVYDGNKLIDIDTYVNNVINRNGVPDAVEGNKNGESPCYYLDDLLDWSESGYEFLSDTEETEADAGSGLLLNEQFLPVNAGSLYDFIETEEEKEQLEETLTTVLAHISEEFIYYKELESRFSDTNFKYYVYDEEKDNYYANTELVNTQTEAASELKKYGRFVETDSKEKGYETNLNIGYRELYDRFCSFDKLFEGDYQIVTVVDTSFPIEDVFTQQDMPYDKLLPWLKILFIVMIFGAAAVIVSLIAMTGCAGAVSDSEETRLNWFDKIKTEFAIVIMLFLGGISLFAGVRAFPYNADDSPFLQVMIYTALFTALFMCLEHTWFLIGYTSLVRRIKAHTMWSNSLCCWIITGVSSVLSAIKVTGRLILFYTGFVLFQIIFVYFCIRAGMLFWMLILIAVDLLAGIRILEEAVGRQKIKDGLRKIADGNLEYKIPLENLGNENRDMAEAVNRVGEGLHNAVEESLKNERLKTDLITNVSHDIKTPLTSIINYVDLLKRENIGNEKIKGYISVLDSKSQRLKQLTEDLVEVSKVSSGNINLKMERLNFVELIHQTIGEFNEKFQIKNLELITNLPKESVFIIADGRRLWRVIENLYNNIAKYALENTRVYADLTAAEGVAQFSLKNISAQALNFSGDELTERFIRGDVSRSTEGSGLGLSIAKNLTESQGGEFHIYLDGDLFKVTVRFAVAKMQEGEL